MAKTPVAKPNAPVVPSSPPFMPVVPIQQSPANLGSSKPGMSATTYTGPREDGCHSYTNYDALTPIQYAGQNQTKTIKQTFRP